MSSGSDCPSRMSEKDAGIYSMYTRSSNGNMIIKPRTDPDSKFTRGSVNGTRTGESIYWYNFGDWTHPYYHRTTDQSNLERAIEHLAPTWNKTKFPSQPLCRPPDVSAKKLHYPPIGSNYKLAHDWDWIQHRSKYSRYTMPDPQTQNFTKQLSASVQYKPMPCIEEQRMLVDEMPKLLGEPAINQEQIDAYRVQADRQTLGNSVFNSEKNRNNSSNLITEEIGKFHALGNTNSINLRNLTDPDVNKRIAAKEGRFHRYMDPLYEPYEADMPIDYDKCEPNIQYRLVQKMREPLKEMDQCVDDEELKTKKEMTENVEERKTFSPINKNLNKRAQNRNTTPKPSSSRVSIGKGSETSQPINSNKLDEEPHFSIPYSVEHHKQQAQKYLDAEPNLYKCRLRNEMHVTPRGEDESEEYLRYMRLKHLAKQDMIHYAHMERGIPGYTGHQPTQALDLPMTRDICQEKKNETTIYRDTFCRQASIRDVVDSKTRLGRNSVLSSHITTKHPYNPYNNISPTQRFEIYDWIKRRDKKKTRSHSRKCSRKR